MGELWNGDAEGRRPDTKGCLLCHPIYMNAQNRHMERQRQTGHWGRGGVWLEEEGMGSECFWVQSFLLGRCQCPGTRQRWWLANVVNALNTAELCTLKWLISCYATVTWIVKTQLTETGD